MDTKRWHDGHWFFDYSLVSWCYLKAGYYEPGVKPTSEDFLHQINLMTILQSLND